MKKSYVKTRIEVVDGVKYHTTTYKNKRGRGLIALRIP